ncbi:MAG: hypothetical protein M3X11_06460 [Acidobacteriota bacterium]|nr:hypothetical protein [Acidobacteriota bacterium]
MKSSSQSNSPNWFTEHLSRRKLGKGLMWTAALSMAGLTVYKIADKDDSEVSLDSLELQRKEGWNVGSTEKTLVFPANPSATDSVGKTWGGLDPNYLISIYQPRDAQWQPFFVPTLVQSLSQVSLNSQIKPLRTGEMADAYGRAEGLRSLIASSPNANQTLIISDLPGPASVALGAAMADTATVIPVFDNWPHPLGVVRSHETLGAMVYYAHEIEEKRSKVPENAPALMLLDGNRLATYTDQDTQFDNRYLAKVPPADQLKQRGIQQVIYLTKDQTQTAELDDINDDFVEWQKNGINVRLLRMSDFKPYDAPVTTTAGTTGTATNDSSSNVVRHYYYGGYPYSHWWFYSHYYYSSPRQLYYPSGGRNIPIPPSTSRPTFQAPSYRPVSRPTVFSASRVGASSGSTGVGRTKPSGFGRTSVRMGSNGSISGTRSGRSGSYGRSGGGFFGG